MKRKPFEIVLCDPPWRFEVRSRKTGLDRSADKHYGTMTMEQMQDIPVAQMTADSSLLAMWVYDPMLPQALELANAWGFKFVTVLFRWIKTVDRTKLNFGLGYHTRGGGCEEVWLFRRGRGVPVLRHDIRKEFARDVREHSRKPDEVAKWIVDLYGDRPRLEMFARTRRPGWKPWGLEVDKFKET